MVHGLGLGKMKIEWFEDEDNEMWQRANEKRKGANRER